MLGTSVLPTDWYLRRTYIGIDLACTGLPDRRNNGSTSAGTYCGLERGTTVGSDEGADLGPLHGRQVSWETPAGHAVGGELDPRGEGHPRPGRLLSARIVLPGACATMPRSLSP